MATSQVSQLPYNIHKELPLPPKVLPENVALVSGDYEYYHYICDGLNDRGWGCGYRTLQTLCSWTRLQLLDAGQKARNVPSLPDIQKALVTMGDKPSSHQGSRDWIGSVEVALCVDYFYDVPCKIVHVSSGQHLHQHVDMLTSHFQFRGSPLMMGGDSDAASKGILGVCYSDTDTYLLVLDPHYHGAPPDQKILVENEMLLW